LNVGADAERRRRIRRSTILLVLLAAAVYALFIALSVSKSP
jgi:hypothetical protein